MREEAEAVHWEELKRLRAARAAEVRQLKAEDAHAERIARMSVGCVRVPWDLRVRVFTKTTAQRALCVDSRVAPKGTAGARPQPCYRGATISSRCDVTMSNLQMPHPCDIRPGHSDITPRGKLRGYLATLYVST